MKLPSIVLAGSLCAAPFTGSHADAQTFRIAGPGVEPAVLRTVEGDLAWAERRIAGILGDFPDTVSVRVLAGRQDFSNALNAAWGIPETACWMVGAADDHALFLLSPAVWSDQACEHDPADAEATRRLIVHEAVHARHGQANPSDDIGLLEDLGWFTEGLATFVSGQLDAQHAGRAAEALHSGARLEHLADAWSGPYRYGVCGSLVAYIDRRWGRDTLRRLLRATSQAGLLAALGTTESELLSGWRRWVLSGA